MSDPDRRGSCSCGWRGSWRKNATDARQDVRTHCAETGCIEKAAQVEPVVDDLMPHEKRKAEQ